MTHKSELLRSQAFDNKDCPKINSYFLDNFSALRCTVNVNIIYRNAMQRGKPSINVQKNTLETLERNTFFTLGETHFC